jgi:hypothetical protein
VKLELKNSSTRSTNLGEHKKHLQLKSEHDEKKIPEKKLYPARKSMFVVLKKSMKSTIGEAKKNL